MYKRIIALVLSLVMVLALCSCGQNTDEPNNDSNSNQSIYVGDGISLACNTADSFNPYKAATELNRLLCSLLYDSLILLDNEYNAVNVLAESITTENNVCTVKLKRTQFSDGTTLTAEDVVYSYNLAKASSGYSGRLSSITQATVESADTIKFKCNRYDAYMVNLLTFPIIKRGSDLLKNEDNVELPPIGCGKYILNSDLSGLTVNSAHHSGEATVKSVRLINTPDEEALSHAIEIGAVDMYYTDLSDCNILRMSGNRVNTALNNLVYIGINLENSVLENNYMRHALSAALDRQKICEDTYYTNAVAATGVFNPAWKAIKGIQSIQTTSKSEISIANFKKIGYNKTNNAGFLVNANNDVIAFQLLVNSENAFRNNAAKLIAEHLAAVGIKINIVSVPYNQYVARLENKQFDLYLAETNINDNMDLAPLLCSGGAIAYGIPTENKTATENTTEQTDSAVTLTQVINGFYSGKNTVSDIAAMAVSEMPIIPVCYRTGILFCGSEISEPSVNSIGNIYGALNALTLNEK